jgi:hypothetical protein
MSATRSESVFHDKIHAGEAFNASHEFASVAAAASVYLLIQVGDNPLHMHPIVVAGGGADLLVEIFETPTFSAAGTGVSVANHLFSSSKTSGATITHTPTTSADGTRKNGRVVPYGQHAAAGEGGRVEWVLTKNTNYLVKITDKASTGSHLIGAELEYYYVNG